jgi:hypothetical protein
MSEGSSGPEDLSSRQVALMVATLIVGTMLIAASLFYTDMHQDAYEEEMRPYDAAVDLVEQVNGNEYLRGIDKDGKEYDYVVLSKGSLEWFSAHPGRFEENITSEFHYRIRIDDLDISDDKHYPSLNLSSYYVFGERPPKDADVVRITVQYTLNLHTERYFLLFRETYRHAGKMMVEVWE